MFRSLTIVFSLAIILAGSIAGYLLYKDVQSPISKAILAVPTNAGLVLESNDFPSLWKKLKKSPSFWNHLTDIPCVKNINKSTYFLDSILSTDGHVASIIKNRPSIISAHLTGKNSFDYLFLIGLKNNGQINAFNNFLSGLYSSSITRRVYEKVDLREVVLNKQTSFSYAFCKGIFISSFNSGLVEDAIRQLNSGNSLLNNSRNTGFEIVQVTADKNADCNVYLNYGVLPKLVGLMLSNSLLNDAKKLESFANWTELDLKVRDDGLMFNGLTHPNDSSNKFLNVFMHQEAPSLTLPYIFPDNTLMFYHFGINDFSKYCLDYKSFLDGQNNLFDYNKSIQFSEQKASLSIQADLTPIVGKEFAMIKTGVVIPGKSTEKNRIDNYLVIKLQSEDNKLVNLLSMDSDSSEIILYRDHTIYPSSAPELWSNLLRGVFNRFHGKYFTIIKSYAVFGESIESIRSFIGSTVSGRTLKTDLGYTEFSDFISSKSNIYFYCNIPLCIKTGQLESSVSNSLKQSLAQSSDSLTQFQAIAYQIANGSNKSRLLQKGNLFYTVLNLKHNPQYKEKRQLFTQAKLNAPLERTPWVVKNHYTGENEIFIQDSKNNIYLIGLGGNIIWKKEIEEQILGDVKQIDIYNNKKLQLLFNTSSSIYLLDRKGRAVESYPIKLPHKATASLSVFDYDNNKKYRILIPCKNRYIYNYDKYGKLVKGWEQYKTKALVNEKIIWTSIRGKDYILTTDVSGNVYVLDRRGNNRKKIEKRFPKSVKNKSWILKGASIEKTMLIKSDSLGKLYSVQLNDSKDSIVCDEFSGHVKTEIFDMTNDGNSEYVFLDKNEILLYNDNKELIFSESFDLIEPLGPYVFSVSGNPKIGVVAKKLEEIYLYDVKGDLDPGFPLYGNSPFVIFSTKETKFLATGATGNFLYIYTLE